MVTAYNDVFAMPYVKQLFERMSVKNDFDKIAFIIDQFEKSLTNNKQANEVFDTIFSSYKGDFALFLTSLQFPEGSSVQCHGIEGDINVSELFDYESPTDGHSLEEVLVKKGFSFRKPRLDRRQSQGLGTDATWKGTYPVQNKVQVYYDIMVWAVTKFNLLRKTELGKKQSARTDMTSPTRQGVKHKATDNQGTEVVVAPTMNKKKKGGNKVWPTNFRGIGFTADHMIVFKGPLQEPSRLPSPMISMQHTTMVTNEVRGYRLRPNIKATYYLTIGPSYISTLYDHTQFVLGSDFSIEDKQMVILLLSHPDLVFFYYKIFQNGWMVNVESGKKEISHCGFISFRALDLLMPVLQYIVVDDEKTNVIDDEKTNVVDDENTNPSIPDSEPKFVDCTTYDAHRPGPYVGEMVRFLQSRFPMYPSLSLLPNHSVIECLFGNDQQGELDDWTCSDPSCAKNNIGVSFEAVCEHYQLLPYRPNLFMDGTKDRTKIGTGVKDIGIKAVMCHEVRRRYIHAIFSYLQQEKSYATDDPLTTFKINYRNQIRLAIRMCPIPIYAAAVSLFGIDECVQKLSESLNQVKACALAHVQRTFNPPKEYDNQSYRNALRNTVQSIFYKVQHLPWFELYMSHKCGSTIEEYSDLLLVYDVDFYQFVHEVILGISFDSGKNCIVQQQIGIQEMPQITQKDDMKLENSEK